MSEPSKHETELAAWNEDVAPNEWARDREWTHPSPEFGPALAEARRRTILRAGIARRGAMAQGRPPRRTPGVRLDTPKVGDIANVHEALSIVEGDGRR